MQPVGLVGLGLMGGPMAANLLKDVKLVQQIADASHTPMPFASVVHDRMVSAVARGRGEMDWTALGLNVSEDAGLEPGG